MQSQRSNDLSDARASLAWATEQMQVLVQRITEWRRSKSFTTVTVPDEPPGKVVVKARLVRPLPLAVNAEAGAIINMIRSSLDILAVTLAKRNGHVRPEDVYFPIAKSQAAFSEPKSFPQKSLMCLRDADRATIEQLKPFDGGNAVLWSLHRLDILRKHHRLVGIEPMVHSINITRSGRHPEPEFLYRGVLEDGTPLFRFDAGCEDAHTSFSYEVTFNDTLFANRRPVIKTLRAFERCATDVVDLFDENKKAGGESAESR